MSDTRSFGRIGLDLKETFIKLTKAVRYEGDLRVRISSSREARRLMVDVERFPHGLRAHSHGRLYVGVYKRLSK